MTRLQVQTELYKHGLTWEGFEYWMRGQTTSTFPNGERLYFVDDVNKYIGISKS